MPPHSQLRKLLGNRKFAALCISQVVSVLGDWFATIALFSRFAFERNASAQQVSGLLISQIAPIALLGPVAGVFVDRWDLRRTMIGSDALRAVLAALLLLGPRPLLTYSLMFCLGVLSCFFVPAQRAALPLIVERDQLLMANSIFTQLMQVAKVITPALAGLIVANFGTGTCFVIDSATFMFSAAAIATITLDRASDAKPAQASSVGRDLATGLRFASANCRLLFLVIANVACFFILGAFDAVASLYVRDVLLGRSRVLGALVSVVGGGTVLGALSLLRPGASPGKSRLVVLGLAGLGVGIVAMSAIVSVVPALISALLLGFSAAYVMAPSQTLVQLETPQELLGRITAMLLSFSTFAQMLGAAAAGSITHWIGIRNFYAGLGSGMLCLALAGWRATRRDSFQT